jgi:hypothetical protein
MEKFVYDWIAPQLKKYTEATGKSTVGTLWILEHDNGKLNFSGPIVSNGRSRKKMRSEGYTGRQVKEVLIKFLNCSKMQSGATVLIYGADKKYLGNVVLK